MHQTHRINHKYADPNCRSLAGNAGSNPAGVDMNVSFECYLFGKRNGWGLWSSCGRNLLLSDE